MPEVTYKLYAKVLTAVKNERKNLMLKSRRQRKKEERELQKRLQEQGQPTSGYLRPKAETIRRIDQAFDHLIKDEDKNKRGR